MCQAFEVEKQKLTATAQSQEGELASLQESLVYVCVLAANTVHLTVPVGVFDGGMMLERCSGVAGPVVWDIHVKD